MGFNSGFKVLSSYKHVGLRYGLFNSYFLINFYVHFLQPELQAHICHTILISFELPQQAVRNTYFDVTPFSYRSFDRLACLLLVALVTSNWAPQKLQIHKKRLWLMTLLLLSTYTCLILKSVYFWKKCISNFQHKVCEAVP